MDKIIKIQLKDNHHLELWFASGEHRFFDVLPYLDKGVFTQLKNEDFLSRRLWLGIQYVGLMSWTFHPIRFISSQLR